MAADTMASPSTGQTAPAAGDLGTLLILVAAAAIAQGPLWGPYDYSPTALLFIAIGTGAALLAALLIGRRSELASPLFLGPPVLMALMLQFAPLLSLRAGLYSQANAPVLMLMLSRTSIFLAFILIAAGFLANRAQLVLPRRALLFGGFALGGIWVVLSSPHPPIDVWYLHQLGAAELLGGGNPYNLSHASPDTFQKGNFWAAYPYPPLVLLLQVPSYVLFGETRFTGLAAVLGAAWGIIKIAERSGVPLHLADALGAFALLHPRAFFVLEQGWTEPMTAALVVIGVHAYVHQRLNWAAVAFGLAAVSKQYAIILFAILFFLPGFGRRRIAIACMAAAITLLPFFAWDPGAFWEGVVQNQVDAPSRPEDSNSVAGFLAKHDIGWPTWTSFLLWLGIGIGLPWWRRGNATAPWLGLALSLDFLFLFGKQAFANYYWLVAFLLVLAAATRGLQADQPGKVPTGPLSSEAPSPHCT